MICLLALFYAFFFRKTILIGLSPIDFQAGCLCGLINQTDVVLIEKKGM